MKTPTIRCGGWRRETERPQGQAVPLVVLHDFDEMRSRLSRSAAGTGDVYQIPQRTPLSDQGGLSSCVGNATADALELVMPDPVRQLSRLFLYWAARRRTRDEHVDGGTYIHNVFAAIQNEGVPDESVWPYDEAKVNERPTLKAFEHGYDFRNVRFHPITTRGAALFDDIELCVRSRKPVVFGADVGTPFMDYFGRGDGSDLLFHYPHASEGGHAMIFDGVGYFTGGRALLARSSWGNGGNARFPGHAWMAEDYVNTTDELYAVDFVGAP